MSKVARTCNTCGNKKYVDGSDPHTKFAPCDRDGGSNFTFSTLGISNPKILVTLTGAFLLIVLISTAILVHSRGGDPIKPTSTPTPNKPTPISLPKTLGEVRVLGGLPKQMIGVNDGTYSPFDISRPDEQNKDNASSEMQHGNYHDAQSAWDAALVQDSNDAEALIYEENLRIHNNGSPYLTFVAGLAFMPTSTSPDTESETMLQGIYVAQKEYNANHPNSPQIRILIANVAGPGTQYVTEVAQQVLNIAKAQHIVAVIDWLTSDNTDAANRIFAPANMPLIAPSATYDKLSGLAPNFFRIVPRDTDQAQALVQYASTQLHAQKALIFEAPDNLYSEDITKDFVQDFKNSNGSNTTQIVPFTTGEKDFNSLIMQAANQAFKPDVIFFTGSIMSDMANFEDALASTGQYAGIPIMAGSAGYVIHPNMNNRLHFIALAYPDEWHNYLPNNPDTFENDYCMYFDPSHHTCLNTIYGLNRAPERAILWYDATNVLLQSVEKSGKTIPISADILRTLPTIKFQGVSGQIAFDPITHDPVNKAFLILSPDKYGHVQMKQQFEFEFGTYIAS
jgi:ABC-type branched-subunit amino acid transport system substrate-binding protein